MSEYKIPSIPGIVIKTLFKDLFKNRAQQLKEEKEQAEKELFARIRKEKLQFVQRKKEYFENLRKDLDFVETNQEKLAILNKRLDDNDQAIYEANNNCNKQEELFRLEIHNEYLVPFIKKIKSGERIKNEAKSLSREFKTLSGAIPVKWDPRLTPEKISKIAKSLIGGNRFRPDDVTNLRQRLYGEKIDNKIVWYGKANSLVTVFYELKAYHHIVSSKEDIAAFITQNFQYIRKGEITDFKYDYAYQVLNDFKKNKRTHPTSKHYLDILKEAGLK